MPPIPPLTAAAATPAAARALPDLPTAIGLAGTMRHAEVAGALSLETSVLIAVMAYSLSER